jgi:ATP-dependent DNA helicase RecQ
VAEEPDELQNAIRSCCQGRICDHTDLRALIRERPVQLAYALALVHASDAGSVIPPWLLFRFPDLTQVLHQLRAVSCGPPSCSYCQHHLSPEAGLRRFFGYPVFRKFSAAEEVPLQQEVVEAALRNESLLALFPTGGGKSLAFQLPALMRGEANRGLTVVISPLQALMKDQVDVLRVRFDVIDVGGGAVTASGKGYHGGADPYERRGPAGAAPAVAAPDSRPAHFGPGRFFTAAVAGIAVLQLVRARGG